MHKHTRKQHFAVPGGRLLCNVGNHTIPGDHLNHTPNTHRLFPTGRRLVARGRSQATTTQNATANLWQTMNLWMEQAWPDRWYTEGRLRFLEQPTPF